MKIVEEQFMPNTPFRYRRVPLLWVICPIFVIIMIGYMWIGQINDDISNLKITVTELNIASTLLERERDALVAEVRNAETDEYIISKARQLYGYMMPNELLFIIKNPDALTAGGEVPVMYVMEGDQL